jgi:hypothetical protein
LFSVGQKWMANRATGQGRRGRWPRQYTAKVQGASSVPGALPTQAVVGRETSRVAGPPALPWGQVPRPDAREEAANPQWPDSSPVPV